MKKLLFVAAIAAFGLVFTGCKSEPATTGTDSTANADTTEAVAAVDVDAIAAGLTEKLNAGDKTAFATALDEAKAKIVELKESNPEQYKALLTKVQEFIKNNADKVKSLVGDNATLNAFVDQVKDTNIEELVNKFTGDAAAVGADAAEKAGELKDAAKEQIDNAQEQLGNAKEQVQDAAKEQVDAAKDAVKEEANKAIDKAASKLGL